MERPGQPDEMSKVVACFASVGSFCMIGADTAIDGGYELYDPARNL